MGFYNVANGDMPYLTEWPENTPSTTTTISR